MAKKKNQSLRNLAPYPDTEKYILVKTKEGNFWRRKRGSVTKAFLNNAFENNNKISKVTMPAASRILTRLEPFTRSLSMGRITLRIGNTLKKSFHSTGKIKLSALDGTDLQEEYPLHKILLCDYKVEQDNGEIRLTIALNKGEVQPQNNLATDYYFELVFLYGDADKKKDRS